MRIEKLAQHRHLIDALVETLHSAWGELPPWSDRRVIRARLESGASASVFPHTVVAIDDHDAVAATGSLKLDELAHHADKKHWLGEIFVLEEHRRQGLGSRVTTALTAHAFGHGVSALYLYTPDQQRLYARLGWREIGAENVNGELVSLMLRRPDDA